VRLLERFLRRPARADALPADATPYQRAQYEWDDRYARQAKAIAGWKGACFVLLLINGLVTAGLFWLAQQSKVVPYIVQVDKLGQALAFGPVQELRSLDQRLYRYQLSLVIHHLRTIHPDPVSQRQSLEEAYAFLAEPATSWIGNYFREHNPFAVNETVTAQVTSVLRLGQDDRSWQVQWYEDHFSLDGRKTGRSYFRGTLQTQLRPPKTTDVSLINPLGLYVTHIDWSQTPTNAQETVP
jgi:type IV secretion system protein VirB5